MWDAPEDVAAAAEPPEARREGAGAMVLTADAQEDVEGIGTHAVHLIRRNTDTDFSSGPAIATGESTTDLGLADLYLCRPCGV